MFHYLTNHFPQSSTPFSIYYPFYDFIKEEVLMVCDKDNIGSVKSIIKNGGILENELNENGKIEQRYWIDLS